MRQKTEKLYTKCRPANRKSLPQAAKDGNNRKTSVIIINSGFTNVKKKSILYMFGHCTRCKQ